MKTNKEQFPATVCRLRTSHKLIQAGTKDKTMLHDMNTLIKEQNKAKSEQTIRHTTAHFLLTDTKLAVIDYSSNAVTGWHHNKDARHFGYARCHYNSSS
jgi:hypothetical protein